MRPGAIGLPLLLRSGAVLAPVMRAEPATMAASAYSADGDGKGKRMLSGADRDRLTIRVGAWFDALAQVQHYQAAA